MAWYDIFTGGNSGLDKAENNINNLAGYSTGAGEKGTSAALNYDLGLLSGDPTKVAETMSPEIKMAQDNAQQNRNTVAQFGNRGGGMNAVMANLDAATRAKLLGLTGQLRQGAAVNAGNLGTANLGLASNDTAEAARIAQEQHQNLMNGLLSKVTGAGLGFLTGKIPQIGKFLFGRGAPQSQPEAQTIPPVPPSYSPVSGDWNTLL